MICRAHAIAVNFVIAGGSITRHDGDGYVVGTVAFESLAAEEAKNS